MILRRTRRSYCCCCCCRDDDDDDGGGGGGRGGDFQEEIVISSAKFFFFVCWWWTLVLVPVDILFWMMLRKSIHAMVSNTEGNSLVPRKRVSLSTFLMYYSYCINIIIIGRDLFLSMRHLLLL